MTDSPCTRRAAAPSAGPVGVARERVLAALQRAHGPLSTDDIAGATGVHPNTVRFHLNRFTGEGIVDVSRAPAAGRGRPRMLYTATDKAFRAGPQNDRLLADVFMHHFARENDGALADAAERAGREWAECALGQENLAGEDDFACLVGLLDEWGFSPIVADGPDGAGIIELCQCPFVHEVEQLPDAVCPLHRGIASGVLERLGGAWRVADLVPNSSPGRCSLTCCRSGG
ncbi:hypothetical protein [uncultured Propionibacterium sp.]|uniref:helix-turn-helix transcriptional regulator n=1 Tax=uncultured Propionibacterium sp. TaxID=218066 RepID=UPI00292E165F|nr:hypothetical protein [uncultured Propionibacterium sp.]